MDDCFETDYSEALESLRGMEKSCREVITAIMEVDRAGPHLRWLHHRPRIVRAIQRFQIYCQREIAHLRDWREDYLKPGEIEGIVSEHFSELARWFSRMMG